MNNTVSPTSLKSGRDYMTGQPIHLHPVIQDALLKEHAAFKVWLNDQNTETCAAWNKLAERFDYLATLTDAQLDGEYSDLTPKNARPVDQEELDTNDLRHPEMM